MFDLQTLVRANVRNLKPYTSARDEFTGTADVYLDANENAFGSPGGVDLNRYPDPLQRALKQKISALKNVAAGRIFIGNGSDEAIDLLFRIFCEPGRDEVIICPPTYGMYQVAADLNDVAVKSVPLTREFALDLPRLTVSLGSANLLFICSPNNPTGNAMDRDDVLRIADSFGGVVVVDEAYADFCPAASLASEVGKVPNLVVLQTLSKAWGLAGARVGLAFASEEIIGLFNRVKPPYNVSELAQKTALAALANGEGQVKEWVDQIIRQRSSLRSALEQLEIVDTVHPSDANFLLAKFADADAVYDFLLAEKIVVRNRSKVPGCEGCLRLTVGTPDENARLISALEKFNATRRTSRSLETTI
jgi:histidinol-phosphate aminotransferase